MNNLSNEPLERQLISILGANREDSYGTQRKRGYELRAAAREIKSRFGLQKWDNLAAKHVGHLVERWKLEDQGRRTLEQRLTHLRWLVRKLGKPNLLPRSNAELGIEPGPRHTRAGKVVSEARLQELLAAAQDPRLRVMILLARYVGLRFKEASLFRPGRDWQGERVWVKRGSKGGQPRYLNIYNPNQVAALQEARSIASGDQGIIPSEIPTFEEWRQGVYRTLRSIGMGRATDVLFHDLRRAYIVERMHYLIGTRRLSNFEAAVIVSREAGHHRTEILDWYVASVA